MHILESHRFSWASWSPVQHHGVTFTPYSFIITCCFTTVFSRSLSYSKCFKLGLAFALQRSLLRGETVYENLHWTGVCCQNYQHQEAVCQGWAVMSDCFKLLLFREQKIMKWSFFANVRSYILEHWSLYRGLILLTTFFFFFF